MKQEKEPLRPARASVSRRFVLTAILAATTLVFSGCMSSRRSMADFDPLEITPGASTKDDVLVRFGKPSRTRSDDNGITTLQYVFYQNVWKEGDFNRQEIQAPSFLGANVATPQWQSGKWKPEKRILHVTVGPDEKVISRWISK